MTRKVKEFIKHFSIELLVYTALVSGYYFLVLHFMGGWLARLFVENRTFYAWVALGLIVAQGIGLELVTTALLRLIRSGEDAKMEFLVSGTHIEPVYLMGVGFVVGVLGGFFGVGGSFITGPALFAAGVPMNFVVGTDLAHIVGKSIVAAKKHRALGNVDMKLGMIMVIGTVAGVETGAQFIQQLKRRANIDWVVGMTFIVILLGISSFMAWESWRTLKMLPTKKEARALTSGKSGVKKKDRSSFAFFAKVVHRIGLPPFVSLPTSGIERISVWAILFVAFVGGVCSGFLGGGAGYIRMPSMIYLLGVPTHIAVGTDLFEIIISASYGTITHALKGNVDILIALVMHTGAAIGAQIGATGTQFFMGPRIRLAFIPLPLIGASILLHQLLTGHHHGG